MKNPETIVNKVIKSSDIVLIIVDARRLKESINKLIESTVRKLGKKFLYVVNKCDLVDRNDIIRLPNSVRISAQKRMGTLNLLRRLKNMAGSRQVVVGVVGFPNTGKSTVINTLKGRKSAPTSPIAGFTKGMQKIRISKNIMMIDTPGVLPFSKKKLSYAMIGAVDPSKLKDPETVAAELIEAMDGEIEKFFGVKRGEDKIEVLEEIAKKKNILMKGGEPDTKRMAVEIIRMCQIGKIRI
ncbi:MAG TPA: GTPase [Candidatus Nanoarchaeia archaeon]|nr:GTPase [Candidatus Nanoarchaeia archaeon]